MVTGAAGQIGYSLLYQLAAGSVFGPNQPIILRLLDIPVMMKVLDGVVMELEDLALPLLRGKSINIDIEIYIIKLYRCLQLSIRIRSKFEYCI